MLTGTEIADPALLPPGKVAHGHQIGLDEIGGKTSRGDKTTANNSWLHISHPTVSVYIGFQKKEETP